LFGWGRWGKISKFIGIARTREEIISFAECWVYAVFCGYVREAPYKHLKLPQSFFETILQDSEEEIKAVITNMESSNQQKESTASFQISLIDGEALRTPGVT
jgi:hypothetical protein